ncbi:MAG: S-layer homology domain-containing protein [Clostridiales bacterium]|nr:S-layer homology domain-containing protein [Clostridiales bacterium]
MPGLIGAAPPLPAFASPQPGVKLYNSVANSALTVSWTGTAALAGQVEGARLTWVDIVSGAPAQRAFSYAEPTYDNNGVQTGYAKLSSATVAMAEFSDSILYQIKVEFFSDGACTAQIPGYFGETVFLKDILVDVRNVSDISLREPDPGSSEAGFKPALYVSWQMPRVFVPAVSPGDPYSLPGSFKRVFNLADADTGYAAALAAVQKANADITRFTLSLSIHQYIYYRGGEAECKRVELGYSTAAPNALQATAAFSDGTYAADVKQLSLPSDDWFMIYLLGRDDAGTAFPDGAAWANDAGVRERFIPSGIPTDPGPGDFSHILRHNEIYPGSIYLVHAALTYWNSAGRDEFDSYSITGRNSVMQVTTLMRLILSKVSDEYVRVDVYRLNINREKDYLAGYSYKVEIRSQGQIDLTNPLLQVNVADFNDSRRTVQAYIRVPSTIVTYVYNAYYTDPSGGKLLSSSGVPFTMNEAGDGSPLTPKGVSIDALKYNPATKTTDVTISWDKPDNWDATSANILYVEFDLNTSPLTSDENAEQLYAGDGTSFGSFRQQYKTVLAAHRSQIADNVTGNRLSYTIKGDSLFKADYGQPPAPAPDPALLYTPEYWLLQQRKTAANYTEANPAAAYLYPAYLLPNTRYFISIRSAVWRELATSPGIYAASSSNASLPAAFTTYPTKYTVPLPFEFSVTKNEIEPTPPHANSVSLRNSLVDWRYAAEVHDPAIPVFYELYMSDDPLDAKPQLAGVMADAPLDSWTDPGWAAGMELPPGDPAQIGAALIKAARQPPGGGQDAGVAWEDLKSYAGKPLQPNKIYYFWVRTYIMENGAMNGDLAFSVMLSATTRPYPQGYDDLNKRLLAPTDLAIAKDSDGNLLVTGETATFEWSPVKDDAPYVQDVLYEFVITSTRDFDRFWTESSGLPFGDPALAPSGADPVYDSFISEFSGHDGNAADRRLLLDPDAPPAGGKFLLNPDTGKYNFLVDSWLFPNTLYYASVRAVSKTGAGTGLPADYGDAHFKDIRNTSSFVAIPLTTLLLDAPYGMRAIIDAELAFDFADSTPGFSSQDYHIYLRQPGETAYSPIGGSQGTVVREGGYVYCRIRNLEFNESYDAYVMRGDQSPAQVHSALGLRTRDSFHAVEVEWKAEATVPNDPYLRYQVAVISQREMDELPSELVEYFELSDLNLRPYTYVADGREYGYHISESAETVNDPNAMLYSAVLLTKPTRMPNGSVEQRPLLSNMRYFVKVRTRKIRREDPNVSAFSKYAGPVDTRTDFEQGSQDEIEEQVRLEDNFMDQLAEFERENVYFADLGDMSANKLILKEDKVTAVLKSAPDKSFFVDISQNQKKAKTDVVYIPGGILLALQEYDKSLTIRTDGADFTLGKNTIDLRYSQAVDDMKRKSGTDDLLARLSVARSEFPPSHAPQGSQGITGVHALSASVIASNRSYGNIAEIIHDYIYDERTGLVSSKLASLAYNTENTGTAGSGGAASGAGSAGGSGDGYYATQEADNAAQAALDARKRRSDAYVTELIGDLRSLVSYRVGDVLEGRNGYSSLTADMIGLSEFGAPLGVSLSFAPQGSGRVSPFVSYDGREWFKLTQNITGGKTTEGFSVMSPGYYSAVIAAVNTEGLADGSAEKAALEKVAGAYDLSDIFSGMDASYRPALPAPNREAVLLYERVLGLERDTFGMGDAQKVAALGLGGIVKAGTLNAQMQRQQAAALLARMYAGLAGLSAVPSARPAGVSDAGAVDAAFSGAVGLCVEKGFLKPSGGKFEPQRSVTRGELIAAIAKMI